MKYLSVFYIIALATIVLSAENNINAGSTSANNANSGSTSENNANSGSTPENNANSGSTPENNASSNSTSENNASANSTSENNASANSTLANNASVNSTSANNASVNATTESRVKESSSSENSAMSDYDEPPEEEYKPEYCKKTPKDQCAGHTCNKSGSMIRSVPCAVVRCETEVIGQKGDPKSPYPGCCITPICKPKS